MRAVAAEVPSQEEVHWSDDDAATGSVHTAALSFDEAAFPDDEATEPDDPAAVLADEAAGPTDEAAVPDDEAADLERSPARSPSPTPSVEEFYRMCREEVWPEPGEAIAEVVAAAEAAEAAIICIAAAASDEACEDVEVEEGEAAPAETESEGDAFSAFGSVQTLCNLLDCKPLNPNLKGKGKADGTGDGKGDGHWRDRCCHQGDVWGELDQPYPEDTGKGKGEADGSLYPREVPVRPNRRPLLA